jgi:predicted pyridoxine 5'-phosphate oxidase superfamily flavin-nucleotide-binding protein
MTRHFLDIASTPSVKAAQLANGVRFPAEAAGSESDRLTATETQFIAGRDSFYIATVSESGWPYMQHRGGPKGFLHAIDDRTLAFADFRGNRQYVTTGNLAANDRASLFLMDYPARRRLKIYARIEQRELAADPELAAMLAPPAGYRARPERAMLLHVEAFDWNCPQHITPRFSEDELVEVLSPLKQRLERLEAENRALREQLAAKQRETVSRAA